MIKRSVFILLISTITLISIFLPSTMLNYDFKISNRETNSAHLSLLNERDININITFPCNTARESPNWITEFFGGPAFRVQADKNKITLLLGHQDLKQVKEYTFKRQSSSKQSTCKEQIFYSYDNRRVTYLEEGNKVVFEVPRSYEIQIGRVILINPELLEKEVSVEIQSSVKESRNLINFILLLITSLLFILLQRNNELRWSLKKILHFTRKNLKLGVFSTIILSLLTLISLPKGDDGWYLLINKYFRLSNSYDNYAFPSPRPSGFLHNLVNSFLSQFDIMLISKLLTIFSSSLIIILVFNIYFLIIKESKDYKSRNVVTIFTFMLLLYVTSLNSMRPEVVVTLLYILILYLIISIKSDSFFIYTSIIIVLIGLGLSTHQQSTILLFASLPILIKFQLLRPRITFKNFSLLMLGVSLAIQLMFIDGNVYWIFESIQRFTEAANLASPGRFLNNYPLYAEWIRPYHLYFSGLSTQPQILMGTLFYISSLYLAFTSIRLFAHQTLRYSQLHFLSMGSSLAPLGLFLNPIKWSWYYAPLFMNILIAFFILNCSKISPDSKKKISIQVLLLGLATSLAFTYPWRTNDFDWPLRTVSIESLNSSFWMIFGSHFSAIFWMIVTGSCLILILFKSQSSLNTASFMHFVFNVVIIASFGFVTLAPPIYDTIKNPTEWTYIRQSVVGLWDAEARCGLAATIKDPKTGLSMQAVLDNNNWSVVTMPAPYTFIPCAVPVTSEAGSWLMPDVSFGWVPIYAQGRLATMTNLTQLGCEEDLKTDDPAQRCFFKWESEVRDLPNYKQTVSLEPDYVQIVRQLLK